MDKKLRETKVGAFLASKAPTLLKKLGEVLPDKGGRAIVKNLLTGDTRIKDQNKEKASKYTEEDVTQLKDITSRGQVDMKRE